MLLAGIGWTDQGLDVVFCDATGHEVRAPVHFPRGSAAALITHLRDMDARLDHALVCIVDSTNGMVDGGLLAAGVQVHRADPQVLSPRPAFGSVDPRTLARTGAARLGELPRLVLEEGFLTGKQDVSAGVRKEYQSKLTSLTRAGRCLTRGPQRAEKIVALTFDDGPNPPWTDRILDVLDRYEVPATFFCVGLQASGHPELLARMAEAGHGIGNHTWSHAFLPDLSTLELKVQVERTDEALQFPTSPDRRRLFRPPYGSGTGDLMGSLTAEDDLTVVLWDVDTQDWAMPGSGAITSAALKTTQPGSIVLMHDGGGDRSQTAEALPQIVEGLLARNYRFALVHEMIEAMPINRGGGPKETA